MNLLGIVYNYDMFLGWMDNLVAQGNSLGTNYSSKLREYIALNLKRIQRLNKTVELSDELLDSMVSLKQKQNWLLITEPWCGDSAQSIAVVAKIAALSQGMIDLKIVLRDENPVLIEKYQTNGSKSIPKLVSFDEQGHELFAWGPRPQEAQQIFKAWKINPANKTWDDFEKELHTWYAKDKTVSTQQEFLTLLKENSNQKDISHFNFFMN